jgi:hypothetical protein
MAFTHHVGHRDSQRSKVYNGEAEFWATRPGEHLVTPSKAAEWVALISDVFGLAEPAILYRRTSGHPQGGYANYNWQKYRQSAPQTVRIVPPSPVIGLYQDERTGMTCFTTVLHELAHHVMFNHYPPNTTASHGPEFCRAYVEIIRTVYSDKVAEQLTDCYRQSRARVARDWRIAI